jgi:hypothetical protein
MHRDQAIEIFLRDESDFMSKDDNLRKLTKDERYLAKNGFVFPQFYGDYYGNNARSIWDRASIDTKEHLKREGIKTLRAFTNHMESIEYRFWHDKFPVYAEWKESNWRKYQQRGYIDFFTGFRCQGVMEQNQVNNFPVQGTAFHVNLATINKIMPRIQSWKTDLMSQIHDSQVFTTEPDEAEDVRLIAAKALGAVAKQYASWLIVPLKIEWEYGEIDQPWHGLKEGGEIEAIA